MNAVFWVYFNWSPFQRLEGVKLQMEFLMDPSTCPMVINAVQVSGNGILSHLFYLTRTWCHSNYLKRKTSLYAIVFNLILGSISRLSLM